MNSIINIKKRKKKSGSYLDEYSIFIYYYNPDELENQEEIEDNPESQLESLLNEKTAEENPTIKLEDFLKPKEIPYVPSERKFSPIRLEDYPKTIEGNTDPKSGATVNYVSSYELPSGSGWRALGMYDPLTHTIYIANDLSKRDQDFVYQHEVAHALGIKDEIAADNYARSKVGYMISGRDHIYNNAA